MKNLISGHKMAAQHGLHGLTTCQSDLTTSLQPRHIPTRDYNMTQSSAPDDGHMVARNMLSNYQKRNKKKTLRYELIHGRTTCQPVLITFLQARHIPTRDYNITQSSAPDDGPMDARNMLSNQYKRNKEYKSYIQLGFLIHIKFNSNRFRILYTCKITTATR